MIYHKIDFLYIVKLPSECFHHFIKRFIRSLIIDIPLKKNIYIIFEYIFEAEYIDIPLIVNLKIDNVLEKDFDV